MSGFIGRVLLGLALLNVAVGNVYAQARPAPAQLTPVVASDATPGGEVRAALRVLLPEGLHANANKPRDPLLQAMQLTATPPAGIGLEEIVWPKAIELAQAGAPQPLLVFEREFAIGVLFKVDSTVKAGTITVPAVLRYQACNDTMCFFPVSVKTSWTFTVGSESTTRHGDLFGSIPFGTGEKPEAAAPVITSTASTTPTPGPTATRGNTPESVVATLAALNTSFAVAGTTNYVGTADFLQFISNAEAGIVERGLFDGRGPLAILLLVLIGGLALNLTPCVLPMIPINLAIIGAGAQAGSRGRGFLLGTAYGSAMALVYGVLGLIVILIGGTFGTINASPWFNLGIALLFVVLALAMFDVLVIDFSRFSSRFHVSESGRGSFLVAFGMGSVAALLAGACVAPVVIQVVLFSSNLYATGTTAALLLPFFLGLGMAIPWPIAGAGIAALPKPGAWMVRVKQVFGIFILGTAVYYGYTAYGIFASRWVDPAEVASSVEEKLKEGWYASLPAGIAEAERTGKPVLIDFWATWCKNCLLMDKITLRDPAVSAALSNYVKIKFQAEDASVSPAKEALEHFGAIGLPTYVILKRLEAGG
jgi:cytochrome c biogenesis protein CcdA/thiol-disulfide isomerase/thioredoxin